MFLWYDKLLTQILLLLFLLYTDFKDEAVEKELSRFGKFASGFKPISMKCRSTDLKYLLSLRRQVLMYLKSPEQMLNVSFYVKYGKSADTVYTASESLRVLSVGKSVIKGWPSPGERKTLRVRRQSAVGGSVCEDDQGEQIEALEEDRWTEVEGKTKRKRNTWGPPAPGRRQAGVQRGQTSCQQEVSRLAEESEGEWDEMEMSQGNVEAKLSGSQAGEDEVYSFEEINSFLTRTKNLKPEVLRSFLDL